MERKRSADADLQADAALPAVRSPPVRSPAGAALMQPAVTDALVRALFEEWAAAGYGSMSLERVAKRAGVGKAALYRRWPSKAALVSYALSRVGVTITDTPDTGSLEGDVRALLLSVRRALRLPRVRAILLDLHAEMARSVVLQEAIHPFQQERRARAAALIDRAVTRGELSAGVDREIAYDLLGAPLYWRMAVVRGPAGRAYVERLAAMLVAALRMGG